jgi:phosphate:Na+ symporter
MPPLVHASSPVARRLPLGNLLVRLTGVIVLAPWLPAVARVLHQATGSDSRLVVDFHLAFNLLLAAVFLPIVSNFSKVLIRWLPDPPQPADPGRPLYLESAALDSASVALANATRETLRMADMLGKMLKDALEVFRTGDRESATEIPAIDAAIRQLGSGIRGYLVAIGSEQTLDDAQEGARLQEIHSAVINIEHVSDIVANGLMDFTVKELKRGQTLSAEEVSAIAAMHTELLESLNLAMAIFLHGDPADAQRLLERKARFRQMEADATAISIRLLRDASVASRSSGDEAMPVADGSGLLLRIVRDLRRAHSHLATFAHRSSDQRRHRWRQQVAEPGNPKATDTGWKRRSPRR